MINLLLLAGTPTAAGGKDLQKLNNVVPAGFYVQRALSRK